MKQIMNYFHREICTNGMSAYQLMTSSFTLHNSGIHQIKKYLSEVAIRKYSSVIITRSYSDEKDKKKQNEKP